MSVYLYHSNLSLQERIDQLEIQRDDGSSVILTRGHRYELTDAEIARARRFAVFKLDVVADAEPLEIARLPIKGTPRDGDVPAWSSAEGAFIPTPITAFTGDIASGLIESTVDSEQSYRVILFANGDVRAIPVGATPPDTPQAPTAAIRLSSVKLSWSSATRASSYAVLRDGVRLSTTSALFYRDSTVSAGASYSYRLQAFDQYGQASALGPVTSAFVDPAINVAPIADVRVWPAAVPSSGQAVVRVNAFDVDVHQLAVTLSVDAGQLAPTDDPSVWMLSAV